MSTQIFDAAEYLETEDDIQQFLSRAAEDGNTQHLLYCLSIAARTKGMTEVAKKAGVTRASLYKSLEEGANPKIETIAKVLEVFGCKLSITPDDAHRHI
jgi:probable addiction module antidote protein|tara:strand:+ start:77 stop:373 length:297 start_codon:yes stop_codon:yes gene_type:complete